MEQDESYSRAMEAFEDGDFESAYSYMKRATYVPQDKRDRFLITCLNFITEQYSYRIKECITDGKIVDANKLKETYERLYGWNDTISEILIPPIPLYIQYFHNKKFWIGTFGLFTLLAIFVLNIPFFLNLPAFLYVIILIATIVLLAK